MNIPKGPYTGLDPVSGLILTVMLPVLVPFWILTAVLRPVAWAYDELMTRAWGGR